MIQFRLSSDYVKILNAYVDYCQRDVSITRRALNVWLATLSVFHYGEHQYYYYWNSHNFDNWTVKAIMSMGYVRLDRKFVENIEMSFTPSDQYQIQFPMKSILLLKIPLKLISSEKDSLQFNLEIIHRILFCSKNVRLSACNMSYVYGWTRDFLLSPNRSWKY